MIVKICNMSCGAETGSWALSKSKTRGTGGVGKGVGWTGGRVCGVERIGALRGTTARCDHV